jgi:molecular chaperone DnaJ
MDHYNTLGVNKNATPDEIKQAYRKLANKHHPDKGGDTSYFQKIQEAYETLGDPNKRQEYDTPMPQGFNGGFGMHGFPGGFSFHTGPMDINDIFGQMFGGHHHRQQTTYRTAVWVTLEQVYSGDEQVLNLQTQTGPQTVKVDIPKGIDNGATLRYENLIPNAILLIDFRIHNHPKFERRGLDLYSSADISILDLIVGTEIEFTTISGKKFKVSVKPQTHPNTTLKISGQGLEQNHTVGDQFIVINPIMPAIIDESITNSILQSRSK